jgi:hypothetical protein
MTPEQQKKIKDDAAFALANPDVLHTPAQYREIIKGLSEMLGTSEARVGSGELGDEMERRVPLFIPHDIKVAKSVTLTASEIQRNTYEQLTEHFEGVGYKSTMSFDLDFAVVCAKLRLTDVINASAKHHSKQITAGFARSRAYLEMHRTVSGFEKEAQRLASITHVASEAGKSLIEALSKINNSLPQPLFPGVELFRGQAFSKGGIIPVPAACPEPPAPPYPRDVRGRKTQIVVALPVMPSPEELEVLAGGCGFGRRDKMPRNYDDLLTRLAKFASHVIRHAWPKSTNIN